MQHQPGTRACIIRNFRNVLNGSNFPPPGHPFRAARLLRHFLSILRDENRGGGDVYYRREEA